VVADDLDLPVGKVKMRLKGSSGGHNGHKSLIASLQTDQYPRIKIGIGKVDKSDTIGHVLGNFDRDELAVMDEILTLCVELCEAIVTEGWEAGLRVLERYYAGR
jgi:PTH1 family peptidyl-tRNA hydrolase